MDVLLDMLSLTTFQSGSLAAVMARDDNKYHVRYLSLICYSHLLIPNTSKKTNTDIILDFKEMEVVSSLIFMYHIHQGRNREVYPVVGYRLLCIALPTQIVQYGEG